MSKLNMAFTPMGEQPKLGPFPRRRDIQVVDLGRKNVIDTNAIAAVVRARKARIKCLEVS